MERNELLKKVKKFFRIDELVCPHVYQRDGELAWQYFPDALLEQLIVIREIVGTMIVNNYSSGGQFSQRGLRCTLCSLVSAKSNAKMLYASAHIMGQGIDFASPTKTAEEIRNLLIENADKLPHPMRLEKSVKWVHFDMFQPTNIKQKIVQFNG